MKENAGDAFNFLPDPKIEMRVIKPYTRDMSGYRPENTSNQDSQPGSINLDELPLAQKKLPNTRGMKAWDNLRKNAMGLNKASQQSDADSDKKGPSSRFRLHYQSQKAETSIPKKTSTSHSIESKSSIDEQDSDDDADGSKERDRGPNSELWKLTRQMVKDKKFERSQEYQLSRLIQQHGEIKDIIYKGFSFGDGALVSDQPRGATIIIAKDSELIEIDAEDYKLI